MKFGVATFALTLLALSNVHAAPPRPISIDRSSSFLVNAAESEELWKASVSPRVKRLYPATKYRFVSDVGGGFTDNKTCVVSARAMLLPVRGPSVIYSPVKSATVFDAAPGLDRGQCVELAQAKLKEAIQSMVGALTKADCAPPPPAASPGPRLSRATSAERRPATSSIRRQPKAGFW